ncbi:MAG: leucine-rich repeat protein, partial [Clostridia bacterium]|nr:leucine-rich repeat protein [Clostridia bacterium]
MATTKATTPKEAVIEYPITKTKFEAYTGDEPFLFVSYSHRDTEKVFPILDALYDKKYRLWYDESCETGNDFRDELRTRIERCEAVLLFVSEASMLSPFCGMEIIVARENGKRLYPIFLDDADVPPSFQILLANTHHGTADDRDKLIKNLVRDLPAVTMDRLTIEDTSLKKCEDNGTSISVDFGVVDICAEAFKNRRALQHIELPNTLVSIGVESFRGCSNLQEMVIPGKTVKVGESAFRDCVQMKSLEVKNDRIKIGERAFENCASLESITLPEGITELYGGVFNSCKSLKRIDLPEQLTILG